MKVRIVSPTKAYLEDINDNDLETLIIDLTYTNTSIAWQLKKHEDNFWWKNSNPYSWEEHKDMLTAQLRDCLVKKDDNGYWIRSGYLPYIRKGMFTYVFNEIKYPEGKALPWASPPKFTPYPYQTEAVKNLTEARHGSISLPTGSGKSLALLLLSRNLGLNTVVVTPSKSIFNELLTEFQKRLGKKYVGGYGDGKKDITKKITIAIGKSLTMLKEGSDAYNFFKNKEVMEVDESHSFASNQLEDVCHGVLKDIPYRFFVSATQTRNDGTEKLLYSIIGKTVLSMEIKDAIEQRYLCPLKFNIINTTSPSTEHKKDPMECKRTHLLYNDNISQIAAKIANASWTHKQESTLILVEELKQIAMLKKYLTVPYTYVHSADKRKSAEWGLNKVTLQDEVDKFNKGEVKVLIGTRAIATGTNIYPTHNVINFVGGGSEIVTKQGTIGRATRKLEISEFKDFHKPKEFSRIFDFKVKGQPILDSQLKKRIEFYKESGGEIIISE